MSKSDPGTIIDPLEIIPEFGADALRLAMTVGQGAGHDTRLYREKIAGCRNFVNKLWNAARFVLLQCERADADPHSVQDFGPFDCAQGELRTSDIGTLGLADRAMLSRLQTVTEKVTEGIEAYRLSEAGETLYSFVWDDFCDWYLELSKGSAHLPVLVHIMRRILVLLHPYCPFATEELWSALKHEGDGMLLLETWPSVNALLRDPHAEANFLALIGAIQAIRRLRADHGIEQQRKVKVTLVSRAHATLFAEQRAHIERMGKVGELVITAHSGPVENVASILIADTEAYLHLEGLVDIGRERARLEKERAHVTMLVASIETKLRDERFLRNAPETVVGKERERLASANEQLRKLEERLSSLS